MLWVMLCHLRQMAGEGEVVVVEEAVEELHWLVVSWCLLLPVLLTLLLNLKTAGQCHPAGSQGRYSQHYLHQVARLQCLRRVSCADGWCLAVQVPAAVSRCWSASGRQHPSPWSSSSGCWPGCWSTHTSPEQSPGGIREQNRMTLQAKETSCFLMT